METGVSSEVSLDISAPQPLIDVDPPPPAPVADAQKTDIPAATDENAETPEAKAAREAAEKSKSPEQQEAKKESRRQRKLNREHDARVAAETENRILREQLAAKQAEVRKEAPAAVESEAPKVDDINPKTGEVYTWEEHVAAVAKWEAKQETQAILKADREARAQQESQQQEQAKATKWQQDFNARETAYAKENADYVELVREYAKDDLLALSGEAKAVIRDSEVAPAILHHLARNPDEHDRIAGLSPLKQAIELGILERTLEKPAAQGKRISGAPAPIKPVPQGRGGDAGHSDGESQAEYEAKRRANGRKPVWAR